MLARDCSILRVGINFDRLYAGGDPDYEAALRSVKDGVNDWNRQRSEGG